MTSPAPAPAVSRAQPGTVAIRCDAGPAYGVGHVMRCVALAEEFAGRGYRIVFVADLASVPWAAEQVARRGFEAVPPSVQDEVGALLRLEPALVVIDSYVLPRTVYDGVRAAGVATLALVDGDPEGRPADIWLDQNIGAEGDGWQVPGGTVRLAGLDFALMRADLRALRPAKPGRAEGAVPRVFAFFGGTDAFGAAPVVTGALVATALPFRATVVAATPELAAACRALPLGPGQELDVVDPTDELAREVRDADVVLSAAGTSSWELLCLGAAAGLVCVADNQETSYARAVDAGLVVGLGYLGPLKSGTAPAFAALLGSAALRAELRERGWRTVDGRGRERVADACAPLLARPRDH